MTKSIANTNGKLIALLKCAMWLLLAALCVYFGCSRFALWQARISPDARDVPAQSFLPADAERSETAAAIELRKRNYAAALAETKAALLAKPQDYSLWLQRGRLEELLEDRASARESLQKAVELAPNFGRPHLFLGNFLIANGEPQAGFAALRRAYKIDPRYFNEVVDFAWRQSNRSVPIVVEWLSPFDAADKSRFAGFLLEQDAGDDILPLVCRADDIDQNIRAYIAARLLKQEKYRLAALVAQQKCDGEPQTQLVNSDFEIAELSSEYGFDWSVPKLPDSVGVFFTEIDFYRGARSLNFSFDGDLSPNYVLLTQIVAVEKKQKYRLRFASQTVDLKTGAVPVLHVVKLGADKYETVATRSLVTADGKWQSQTIDFAVDERTEAVEIKVSRSNCAQTPCPIFGQLRLDDFALEIKP